MSNVRLMAPIELVKKLYIKIRKMETFISATLLAGETSLTIQDSSIHSNSMVDIYSDRWGVSPKTVVTTDGQITMTFKEYDTVVNLKVRVL